MVAPFEGYTDGRHKQIIDGYMSTGDTEEGIPREMPQANMLPVNGHAGAADRCPEDSESRISSQCKTARQVCIFVVGWRRESRRPTRRRSTIRGHGSAGVRTRYHRRRRRVGLPDIVHFLFFTGDFGEYLPESFDEPPRVHPEFDEGLLLRQTAERCPKAGESEEIFYFFWVFAELFQAISFGISSSFAPSTVAPEI